MSLSEEEVRHIAVLARLGLSDEEITKFSRELSGVLQYVKVLDEVNTDRVEPTAQVTGLHNISFADELAKELISKDDLLAATPLPLEKGQIKVKQVLESENQ